MGESGRVGRTKESLIDEDRIEDFLTLDLQLFGP